MVADTRLLSASPGQVRHFQRPVAADRVLAAGVGAALVAVSVSPSYFFPGGSRSLADVTAHSTALAHSTVCQASVRPCVTNAVKSGRTEAGSSESGPERSPAFTLLASRPELPSYDGNSVQPRVEGLAHEVDEGRAHRRDGQGLAAEPQRVQEAGGLCLCSRVPRRRGPLRPPARS